MPSLCRVFRCAIVPCLVAMLPAGCSGILDGIYDAPVADTAFRPGFSVPEAGGVENRLTLRLDVRDYDKWVFVDLHRLLIDTRPVPDGLTGEWDGRSVWTRYRVLGSRYEWLKERPVDAQETPAQWDLAVHHFDVRTNGGAVARTALASMDLLPERVADLDAEPFVADAWTDRQCIVDLSGMFDRNIWYQASFVNPVLTEWVRMDLSTPPPRYEASRRVYLLRMADGTLAAMRLRSYMSEAGTKGFLTIDVRYPYE